MVDRTRQRRLSAVGIHMVSLFVASLLVGFGNVGALYLRAGQLVVYSIMNGSCAIGYYLIFWMVSSNLLRTSQITTTDMKPFISMAAAYLLGSQMFRDPPYYYKAKYATIWPLDWFDLDRGSHIFLEYIGKLEERS